MADTPTPDDGPVDLTQGGGSGSLGDRARAQEDPVLSQSEDVPEDGGHIQEES